MFYNLEYESAPSTTTLIIPAHLMTEILQYIHTVNVEVGGLLIGYVLGQGKYQVTRVHLSRQVVHGTEVDVEDHDTLQVDNELKAALVKKFKAEIAENPSLASKLVFMAKRYQSLLRDGEQFIGQWHSHVNMPVFMSGGDEATLNRLANSNNGTMIMLIMNKKDERKAWVKQGYPLNIDPLKVTIVIQASEITPMPWKQAIQNLRACLFSADKYRVAKKGELNEGKIIERRIEDECSISGGTIEATRTAGGIIHRPIRVENESENEPYRDDGNYPYFCQWQDSAFWTTDGNQNDYTWRVIF